jgi:glycerol kinase
VIVSVDQGTTNTKALVVGRDGRPVFRTSAPVSLRYPEPGFVEADPEALWASVEACVAECVAFAGKDRISGVAISNQRETALVWERATGRALTPAMSWQCRRSAAVCERLGGRAEEFRARCGLPLDPLVSASKWAWALEADPELAARAWRGEICLGTVESWLIWKLSGGKVYSCDHTNASRTGLLNLATAAWDPELLAMFGIPLEALPEVRASSSVFGRCMGVDGLEGVPVVAAIGDSHAAMVAHGAGASEDGAGVGGGTVKATYGTGSSLMTLTAGLKETDRRLASTIAWSTAKGVRYALEGNITMAGAAVQWVGEFLGLGEPLRETLALAETVGDAGGVVLVPAMAGLAAPWWNSAVRGCVTGLQTGSTRAHLARAAVEAIAFQVRDVFCAMEEAAGGRLPELRADGGATRNEALMQFQADVLGRPVLRSACEDLSALGAAWLGGLTLGWWGDEAEFGGLGEAPTRFVPEMKAGEREQRCGAWRAAVEAALLAAVLPAAAAAPGMEAA